MYIGQSIGDLAQTFVMRQRNAQLQFRNQQLNQEVVTGQTSDPVRHLSGNLGQLSSMDRDLTVLESHRFAAVEARITTTAMQTALDRFQTVGEGLASAALSGATLKNGPQLNIVSEQANQGLGDMVAALNTRSAGRALFGGTAVDKTPVASADAIMSAARSATNGASSASDVRAALDAMFDGAGAYFETSLYAGDDNGLAPFQLGEGEAVQLDIRATDPAIKDMLKNTVALALAGDPGIGLDLEQRQSLAGLAGSDLQGVQGGTTEIRARLGHAESRIEHATARLSTEMSALEQARDDLLAVDPYEAATELQSTQSQIEMLYNLTARSARLSLVSFLK